MRIGLLTTSFPRFEDDVAGTFVLDFARALTSRGHEVEALVPEPASGAPPRLGRGIDVRFVPYIRPRRWARTFFGAGVPDNLRADPWAWAGLPGFIANLTLATARAMPGWDAVVSHWALPCGLVAGQLRGDRPHLAVCHSADLHLLSRLPGRGVLATRIAQGATRLWFVAQTQRERFLGWTPQTQRSTLGATHVGPMGVDLPRVQASRARLRAKWRLNRMSLLALGRLVPIKGVDIALHALRDDPSVELIVAGQGPETGRLQDLARRWGVRARFLGQVDRAARRELLSAADALVLPSRPEPDGREEGLPTVLLEAMAHGLPIIASRTGGVTDIIEHDVTGLICTPGDVAALRRSVARMCGSPALRRQLATNGRQAVGRHSWSTLAPRIEDWLR